VSDKLFLRFHPVCRIINYQNITLLSAWRGPCVSRTVSDAFLHSLRADAAV